MRNQQVSRAAAISAVACLLAPAGLLRAQLEWEQIGPRNQHFFELSLGRGGEIYGSFASRLVVSRDDGASWDQLPNVAEGTFVRDLFVDPREQGKVYAVRLDGGSPPIPRWSRLADDQGAWVDIPCATARWILFPAATPGAVACFAPSGSGAVGAISHDHGITWQESVEIPPEFFVGAPDRLIGSGANLQRSTDGGRTFEGIPGPSGDVRAGAVTSSGVLLAVTATDLHRSTDLGVTWQLVDVGASAGTWRGIDAQGETVVIWGSGGTRISSDLTRWADLPGFLASSGGTLVDPRADQRILGIDWSTENGGATWQPSDPSDPSVMLVPRTRMVRHPLDESRVFSPAGGVGPAVISGDFGRVWSEVPSPVAPTLAAALVQDPADLDRFFALQSTTIFRSADRGTNWLAVGDLAQVAVDGASAAGSTGRSLVVAPGGSRVWALRERFQVADSYEVLLSDDDGSTWRSRFSFEAAAQPVLVADRFAPERLYLLGRSSDFGGLVIWDETSQVRRDVQLFGGDRLGRVLDQHRTRPNWLAAIADDGTLLVSRDHGDSWFSPGGMGLWPAQESGPADVRWFGDRLLVTTDYGTFRSTEPVTQGGCDSGPFHLCLGEFGRFDVSVSAARSPESPELFVPAGATELTSDTGSFWFFDADNLEIVVKVLDGCDINSHFWVFTAGLTDLGVRIMVFDSWTGLSWRMEHPGGQPFQPGTEIAALPCSVP